MPEKWTGRLVGRMHNEHITYDDLAKELGVKYNNLAQAGLKVEDMFDIIGVNIAEIEKADIITVDFGTADFVDFATAQIISRVIEEADELKSTIEMVAPGYFDQYKNYEMDWTRFEEFVEFVDVEALLADIRAKLVENGVPEISEIPVGDLELTVEVATADVLTYAVETYLYAFVNYAYSYADVIEAIHAINPEAEIVALGAYNMLEGVEIDLGAGAVIDLTQIGEMFTKALNAYAFASAVVLPNTTYVGIEDARADVDGVAIEDILSIDEETAYISINADAFDVTAAGHAYIAEQILDAMNMVCEHLWDGCEDAECNNCGETREPGKHVYDDCLDEECNVCGEHREAPGHVYDNDCADTTCNVCGKETREAAEHVYDNDCTDTTCANCGVTRPAAEHVYDNDCTDTTCANCGVTRPAAEHVYDDCTDTTCANCGVTRQALEHEYEDCADATCENCDYRRVAPGHVYDNDCADTTCNVCNHETRVAAEHVYDNDCTDTTCANCGVTRPAAEHVYDNDCADTTCANCGVTRPAADHVYDNDCADTTCANCGVTRPAAEHVYDDCADETCANCAVTRTAPGHTWGEWKTTKAPTFDEAGEKERACSVCGKVETEEIAKLVSDTTSSDTDETTKPVGGTADTEPVDNGGDDGEDKELSAGAIVGISVGAVLLVQAGGFAIFWFVIKKNTWAGLLAIFKRKG